MRTFNRLLATTLVCCTTLTGCGSSSEPPAPLPVQKSFQSPAGFWNALDVMVAGQNQTIDCLVAKTLSFSCRLYADGFDFLAAISGTLQVDGPRVTGSGTYFAAPGRTLADGSTAANLTISNGTISEFNFLTVTMNAAGVQFIPSFDYNPDLHDRGSALATVAGVYPKFDFFGDPASLVVDNDGAISSQSSSGCVCNGQVSIIEDNFNVYDVTLDVSSCDTLDGSYVGLGMTAYIVVRDNAEVHDPTSNDVFVFNVFTNQSVIDGIASE